MRRRCDKEKKGCKTGTDKGFSESVATSNCRKYLEEAQISVMSIID